MLQARAIHMVPEKCGETPQIKELWAFKISVRSRVPVIGKHVHLWFSKEDNESSPLGHGRHFKHKKYVILHRRDLNLNPIIREREEKNAKNDQKMHIEA